MSQRVGINYERDGREVRGLAAWRVLEHFGGQADEDVLATRLRWSIFGMDLSEDDE
jgi:hypothetical protein